MGKQKGKLKWAALAALIIAGLAAHYAWAATFWTAAYLFVRYTGMFLLAVLLVFALPFAGIAVSAVRAWRTERAGNYYRGWGAAEFSALTVGVAAALTAGSMLFVLPYETDVAHKVDSLEYTEESVPGFAPRFPYLVADGLMARSVGDAENVRVSRAGYTDPAQGEWASLVSGVGSLRPSLGVVVKNGDTFARCDWPQTGASGRDVLFGNGGVGAIDGMFGNKLSRQLRLVKRNTSPHWEGLGAWCTDEGPWVLIPATRPAGILRVHAVPAGVWTIDPAGNIDWHDSVQAGDYPVPVIGPELAGDMVDANRRLTRNGEEAGWRSVFLPSGKVGLERPEASDRGGMTEGDPDFGNAGEFLLHTEDGRWVYATPLTPVGASETVVAIAIVEADSLTAGKLPEVTIHRLDETKHRRSNLEIAKVLRTSFDREVQWEAGYEIFELAPLTDGTWSATIGQSLEVKYRAIIEPDGEACLYLYDTMQQVLCSGGAQPTENTTTPPGELGQLTDEELYDLLDEIARELRNRS